MTEGLNVQVAPLAPFNDELLSGIALAWGDACDYLQDPPRRVTRAGRLPPEQLYALIPNAEIMVAEEAPAQHDARLSSRIARQVTGRMANLELHHSTHAMLHQFCCCSETHPTDYIEESAYATTPDRYTQALSESRSHQHSHPCCRRRSCSVHDVCVTLRCRCAVRQQPGPCGSFVAAAWCSCRTAASCRYMGRISQYLQAIASLHCDGAGISLL